MARGLELSRRSLLTAVLLGAINLAFVTGCRQSPPPPPKAVLDDPGPLTKAREAMDRRDYSAAADLLREAIARRPGDLEAHYRLGVSASHLDQSDEASREFDWVVAHGDLRTSQVQIARDWLASRTTVRVPTVSTALADASAPKPEMATLAGRAVGPEGVKPRLQLFLKGLPGTAVKDEYHILRTDQQGSFRFTDVVPGDYMLTNAVAGPPAWRLRVSLARGERLVLDLSPSNHATIRDDFPDPRP
jgi:hypothetical protein